MTKIAKLNLNRYPIYDQNGSKTIPFGAAHTYIAHIREYPPPPGGPKGGMNEKGLGLALKECLTSVCVGDELGLGAGVGRDEQKRVPSPRNPFSTILITDTG